MKKLVNSEEAKEIRAKAKEKNKIVVFTNGCFDILHRGHIESLRQAKELGDILIVGLNTDNSIHKFKSKSRPIFNQNDRAEVLSALAGVDYIVLFDESTPEKLIEQIKPDILVKGSDYKIDEIAGREIVQKCGGKVVIIPLLPGYSTTQIINKIKNKLDCRAQHPYGQTL
ncbi:D-glycero-beta-D-manno-heptose 1-phosphate adenylyltransferase [candidate division WOR-3 bacterium]|nr:D-glycero-beta-D-manno-heptose 1-phosphate adenylyltransferase [candidate division WOR-3 bacterium]